MTKLVTITLEDPWYRCKQDGLEFRSLTGPPKRCPTCKGAEIEMVVDIADELKPNPQNRSGPPTSAPTPSTDLTHQPI